MLKVTLPFGALALLGVVVGIVGTGGHRFEPYWGSVLVLSLVLAAGTYARAWRSWMGLMVFAQVWIATVLLLYYFRGPGESVMILGDSLGKVWMYGGSIMAIVPAFIPKRLVTEGAHVER